MRRLTALLLILSSIVAVAAVGYLVDRVRTPRHTAEAVLVTPAGGAQTQVGDPDQGSALAATYAQLLPTDRAVAEASDASPAGVRGRLTARRRQGGSILHLTYAAATADGARKGAEAMTAYLEDAERDASSLVEPGSLRLTGRPVSLPATAVSGLYRERVTYLVSSSASAVPADAQAANRLAANYAGLLPEDNDVLAAAARRSRLPLDEIRDGLKVTNDTNTSVLRVAITNADYDAARGAVAGVIDAVTGSDPASDRIVPRSLEVARRPAASVDASTASSLPMIAGGALLGLILGLMAVLAYSSRHPRVTSAERARELLSVPVTDLGELSPALARSLLARWRESRSSAVVIVPESPRSEAVAEDVGAVLAAWAEAAGDRGIEVRTRAYADAFEPATDALTFDVLVVEQARRFDRLRASLQRYEGRGGRIGWVLLGSPAPSALRVPAPPQREREGVSVR
jgi:hypothetical protein